MPRSPPPAYNTLGRRIPPLSGDGPPPPTSPSVASTCQDLLLPATAEVVAEFMALADSAPEELSAIANVMPAPPLAFVPAEQHG